MGKRRKNHFSQKHSLGFGRKKPTRLSSVYYLGNDELKLHFFVEVNGVLMFKLQDLRFFLDKHSINNSYTKYANRIGLPFFADKEKNPKQYDKFDQLFPLS